MLGLQLRFHEHRISVWANVLELVVYYICVIDQGIDC